MPTIVAETLGDFFQWNLQHLSPNSKEVLLCGNGISQDEIGARTISCTDPWS